jgi:hypothetical protein
MKKKIEISNKFGIIDIKGDNQESVLYLNSLPIQYTWFAEIGSTWRYHIAKGVDIRSWAEANYSSEILRNGIDSETEFDHLVEYYSQFLKTGEYEFGVYDIHEYYDLIHIPEGDKFQSFDYYGGCPDLIPTQSKFEDQIINDYKQLIKEGVKPSMVIFHISNSHILFILDGHHKFLAYGQLKIKPRALIISKLNSSTISLDQSLKMAEKLECNKENYLNWIKNETRDKYYNMKLDLEKEYEQVKFNS